MTTNLYWFSSTGNSLKAAKDLAGELGDAKLLSIAKAMSTGQIDQNCDKLGIVFPVYMWGLPSIVVEFINKLKPAGNKYIFTLVTYGGTAMAVHTQAEKLLKANGLELAGGFGVQMPGNYTPMYGARPDEKQRGMFEKERAKIKDIAAIIKSGEKGKIDRGAFLFSWLLSGLVYNMSMPKVHGFDKKFVLEDSCTGCGLCEKVCPVSNIKLVDNKPQWLHKCEHCMGCLQWCPVEAIQYGKSKGRKRYRNPDIKVEELFLK
jgi:ferredoxin